MAEQHLNRPDLIPPSQSADKYIGWCETCQKRMYTSRKAAKRVVRLMHSPGLRAYPCPVQPGFFHNGHLPQRVRAGDVTAAEHYTGEAS